MTIQELARDYLDAIRAAQPFGPYRLLGWSFGGAVCAELAHLIEAAGEKMDTSGEMMRKHQPAPITAPILLFHATEATPAVETRPWQTITTGRLVRIETPFRHENFDTDDVAAFIGPRVNDWLQSERAASCQLPLVTIE